MITYLKGKVIFSQGEQICLLANNVGWLINIRLNTVQEGEDLELYTYMYVRENEMSLWGFLSLDELTLFKMLIAISGIGAKTAANLIWTKGVAQIVQDICFDNDKGLKVAGLGEKNAKKIILELSSKITTQFPNASTSDDKQPINGVKNKLKQEASEALVTLGYKSKDVEVVLMEILKENESNSYTLEQVIKKALTLL